MEHQSRASQAKQAKPGQARPSQAKQAKQAKPGQARPGQLAALAISQSICPNSFSMHHARVGSKKQLNDWQ